MSLNNHCATYFAILDASLIFIQYADPKMAGLIKEGPALFGSAYCN